MDILAVYKVVADAVDRGRNGEGPTLIEALNYRLGAHSMSGDDPTRYRGDEMAEWEAKEPLTRFRKFLEKKKLWTEEEENRVIEDAKSAVTESLKKADSYKKMTLSELVDSMFEVTPPHLKEQENELLGGGRSNG
jgi:pyruvate dehydrogenase E1 component alpha subunit